MSKKRLNILSPDQKWRHARDRRWCHITRSDITAIQNTLLPLQPNCWHFFMTPHNLNDVTHFEWQHHPLVGDDVIQNVWHHLDCVIYIWMIMRLPSNDVLWNNICYLSNQSIAMELVTFWCGCISTMFNGMSSYRCKRSIATELVT